MHGREGDMDVHCNLFEISALKCLFFKKKKEYMCYPAKKKSSGK